MASRNLQQYLRDRFFGAIRKLDTEDQTVLRAALDDLSELVLDPALPRMLRLRATFALADLEEDWCLAEDYRKSAEDIYTDIRSLLPPGTTRKAVTEIQLVDIRKGLDELATDQAECNPRKSILPKSTEIALVPESEGSEIATGGRSEESVTSQLTEVSGPATVRQPEGEAQKQAFVDNPPRKYRVPAEVELPLRLLSPSPSRSVAPLHTDASQRSRKRRHRESEVDSSDES